MSASSQPLVCPVPAPDVHLASIPAASETEGKMRVMVRRRATMQQGKALEVLGHAIEYLVDSRLFLVGEPRMLVESAAIDVLSRCSRDLFATCEAIVPVSVRFRQWASRWFQVGQPKARASDTVAPAQGPA